MKRVVVKKLNRMAKLLGIFGGFFLFGATIGQIATISDLNEFKFGYKAVAVDNLAMTNVDTIISRVEGEDLNEEKQALLNWLFKSKRHEVSQKDVYEHLKALNYHVNLVDELINIPAENRTPSIQQQLFRGAEHVIIDHESGIVWCEYEAPENLLTESILAIN